MKITQTFSACVFADICSHHAEATAAQFPVIFSVLERTDGENKVKQILYYLHSWVPRISFSDFDSFFPPSASGLCDWNVLNSNILKQFLFYFSRNKISWQFASKRIYRTSKALHWLPLLLGWTSRVHGLHFWQNFCILLFFSFSALCAASVSQVWQSALE